MDGAKPCCAPARSFRDRDRHNRSNRPRDRQANPPTLVPSPHLAAKHLVQEAFEIGFAIQKALSLSEISNPMRTTKLR